MSKSIALEKIKKIQGLRKRGVTYTQIAKQVGAAPSTAYHHGKNFAPAENRHTPHTCGQINGPLRCERHAGHHSVHLANNEEGLLYWW